MKRFEVWLDESGAFYDTLDSTDIYSFVGGILIESGKIKNISWDILLPDSSLNHAKDLSGSQKRSRLLPILTQFKQSSQAQFVFFENIEYTGSGDNQALYLEILTEGILKLLQYLESRYGCVQLDMTIASRTTPEQGHIDEAKYQRYMEALLEKRKRQNSAFPQQDSQVIFHLKRGTQEKKLILADFTSNIRRQQIRKARVFQTEDALRTLQELFIDALVFSRSELSPDKRIRMLLAQGDISEAVMEIYVTDYFNAKERRTYLFLLLERMESLNYRLIKSQLKQLTAEIMAFTSRQDDYDKNIFYLKRLQDELLPELQDRNYPCELLRFENYLQLSDAYLRAGRFTMAWQVLDTGLNFVKQAENSLENVFILYRMYEKMAVFYIDSYQFNKAIQCMEEVRKIYIDLLEWFVSYPIIESYFPSLKSEYYGDVLCMEIYAMLFQGKDLDEIRSLSDIGLQQYPRFEGELERHRQYRSRLEQRAGNIEESISWLIQAIDYEHRFGEEITEEVLIKFWDMIEVQENTMSQEFYMMYYLLIMVKSKELEHPLTNILFSVFSKHTIFQRLSPQLKRNEFILIESKEWKYHPREVIYTCLGDYYRWDDKEMSLKYYQKAMEICGENNATLTLKMRKVLILAASISLQTREKITKNPISQICKHIRGIRKSLGSDIRYLEDTLVQLDIWEKELEYIEKSGSQLPELLWQFVMKWRY